MKLVVFVPVRTSTPGNSRRHWRADWQAAKTQRAAAYLATVVALNALSPADRKALEESDSVTVRVTRFSGRRLDPQNVLGAAKHVIDGLADALGVNDGDDWYDWQMPTQERGAPGIRIELETP